MSRRLVVVLGVLGLVVMSFPTVAAAIPATVKVMTLNIFYGGDEWDPAAGHWCRDAAGCPETLEEVADTIRAAGPDVVGLQEATANECRLLP